MLTQIILWVQLPVCLITISVLLVKRTYPVSSVLLASGLLLTGWLGYLQIQLLESPDRLAFIYTSVLLLQVATTFCLYYYTKTIFRDNSEIYRGPGFWISIVLALSTFIFCLSSSVDGFIYSPDFAEERIIYLTKSGFGVYLLLMLYLVFGLVQLERTFSGLHQLQRWNIKLEIIGSGLLLGAMSLYFSHSLLYRSLDFNYIGWRALVVIVACSVLTYSRLFRGSGERLALSRGIAHRSFVLLIVGGYLIILGLLGEGLRYLNLDNTKPVIYALLLVGAVALAVVFLSEKLRRRLVVTLHKNFYQSKYDYRQQWDLFTRRVSANKTLKEIYPAILDLFCQNLACKGASLYLRDHESGDYLFTSAFNCRRDWRPFPENDPLVELLNGKDWTVNLENEMTALDESVISTFSGIDAFLVVPLQFDAELVGFIILGEQINREEELTYEDYDLLRMLARQSVATIQGLRLSEQISTTRELASIGKLSTFVLHDLKNQVSGLSLMLDNAKVYISDPDFQDDMIETVETTVHNMKGLIARLKNVKEKPSLVLSVVALAKIVGDALDTAGGDFEVVGESVDIAVDEEEIYKVLLNLLVNAKEASPPGQRVKVEYGQEDDNAYVRVIDAGTGMSQEFVRDKLFKPFETTKKHGFGIGLYQCRQIIDAHNGKIDVDSREGVGTTFRLTLPLAP